jgi:hypothetical protein
MRVVGDAVGGVAEQPPPKFRMVAVADDNQVVAAFLGEVHDDFGGVAGAAFAGDFNAVLLRQFRHLAFAFLEIIGGGFGFAFGFAGQVGVAGSGCRTQIAVSWAW